jgi:hypothetical protein
MNQDFAHRNDTPPGHEWGSALIVACLALGFAMSWGSYELHQRFAQRDSDVQFRHDLDLLTSQQSDLGELLADPRTKLVRLVPVNGRPQVRLASVAWNDQRQSGAVFCGDLADGGSRRFQVWLLPSSGTPIAISFGPSEAGRAVYPFSSAAHAAFPSQIVLTEWTAEQQPGDAALARGDVP